MPEVSVIMPVYNGEKFLAQAIESVLNQNYQDLELVCVNDGSTDRSQEIIDSFFDPRLKSIVQENAGLPAARNIGIKASSGSFIAFLDCDDIYLPFSVEKRVSYLSVSPERVFVHTDFIPIDESGNQIADSLKQWRGIDPISGMCFKSLFLHGTAILPSSVMMKKEIFDRVGLFDGSFLRAQDYDLWLRIAYHYPLFLLNECCVKYRVHSQSLSNLSLLGDLHSARALLKAAANYSDIEKLIGALEMRKRLYRACYDVAYDSLKDGDLKAARYWFKKSFLWNKTPKVFLKMLFTYLRCHSRSV